MCFEQPVRLNDSRRSARICSAEAAGLRTFGCVALASRPVNAIADTANTVTATRNATASATRIRLFISPPIDAFSSISRDAQGDRTDLPADLT
jgi:hypothetical protein